MQAVQNVADPEQDKQKLLHSKENTIAYLNPQNAVLFVELQPIITERVAVVCAI